MAKSVPAVNIWVARIVPLILIGVIVYSAYVVTKVVAIDYLISPSPALPVRPRPGPAIAILVVYYLLLLALLVCYVRLLLQIATGPGYVPRSAAWEQNRRDKDAQKKRARRGGHGERRSAAREAEKSQSAPVSWLAGSHDPESGGSKRSSWVSSSKDPANHRSSSPLDRASDIPFWQRDVFVCKSDGRPPFCSSCLSFKTDRTHHCSEVDRCVLKMDHFCPWVGGIISETSFKFFVQFLVYAALFCITVLTPTAYFIAERRRNEGPGFLDIHFFLILGISALFLLFTLGMAASSIQLAFLNSSTVENLDRQSKVHFLAFLISSNPDGSLPVATPNKNGVHGPPYQLITYPRPAEEEHFLLDQAKQEVQNQKKKKKKNSTAAPNTATTTTTTTTTTAPIPTQIRPIPPKPPQQLRTFAILATKPGENPFDIGAWNNIREVMGHSISEWLLPIRTSPCAHHASRVSLFPLNEDLVARLKSEAGLVVDGSSSSSRSGRTREPSLAAPLDGTVVSSDEREGEGEGERERDERRRRRKSHHRHHHSTPR